jgi:O-antigen/teichoic acid export membrane protein
MIKLINLFIVQRHGRIGRAMMTSLSSLLVTAMTIGTGLVSVPLTVGYLGRERYGVWVTISSMLTWLAISDIGFGGNAMINALAEANGRDDHDSARELVSTGFFSLTVLAALLTAIFAISFPFVSWPSVFNYSSSDSLAHRELEQAVILAFLGFALVFPGGVVTAIFHGYQEGYLANCWAIVGQALSLACLVLVSRTRSGLPLLVLAYGGVRVLTTAASAGSLFWRRPWLIPSLGSISARGFRRLIGLGGKYLIVQLSSLGMFQSQPMIITQLLGPSQVGIFSVTQRLVSLPSMLIASANNSLFPAYGEARARGDWGWIRRTFRWSLIASTLFALCTMGPVVLVARPLIRIWAGADLVPSIPLVLLMAVYVFLAAVITPMSIMLAGLERVGAQALLGMINATLTVVLGIVLVPYWGLPGMGFAMVLGFLIGNCIGQTYEIYRVFRSAPVDDPEADERDLVAVCNVL